MFRQLHLKINTQITSMEIIDLFAGCGGLSLGFQNSGFKIVAALDLSLIHI